MEAARKEAPKETLEQQKRICEVSQHLERFYV